MTPTISTWLLLISIGGGQPSYPERTLMIQDIESQQECQRVGKAIVDRFNSNRALCVEVKKVKP